MDLQISPTVLVWIALGIVGLLASIRFLRIGKRVGYLRKSIAARTVFSREAGGGDADSQCSICFGELDEDEVHECVCAAVSHVSCAELTGSCPYCQRPYDPDGVRARKLLRCPSCGERMPGYSCDCGTVVPNHDGTFVCPCGEDLRTSSGSCPSCGRTYGVVSMPRAGGGQTV